MSVGVDSESSVAQGQKRERVARLSRIDESRSRMRIRNASCACGQLAVQCSGEPELVSRCHCLQCQRRTGSVFGLAAFFVRDHVDFEGEAGRFVRTGDSGFEISFYFCKSCGSTVYWEPKRRPESIAVSVGCFADPGFPEPSRSVYEEHQHAWLAASNQAPNSKR